MERRYYESLHNDALVMLRTIFFNLIIVKYIKRNLDTASKFCQSLGPSLYVGSKLVLFSASKTKTNSLSLSLNESKQWFFLAISPQEKNTDSVIREFFYLRNSESRIFCFEMRNSAQESGIQLPVTKNRHALPY